MLIVASYNSTMAERPSNLSLTFGMIASIVLHLTVLVPVLLMAMTASRESQQLRSELPAEEAAPPEQQQEREEPMLGIDEGTPSSVSWIGYEEYEEHLAQLAEMDQAAFTQEPSGAMGTEDAIAPVEEVVEAREPVEPTEFAEAEQIDEASEDASEDADKLVEAVEAEVEEEAAAPEESELVTLPERAMPHVVLPELPTSLDEEAAEPEAELPAITEDEVVEGEPEEPAEAVEQLDEREDDVAEAPAEIEDEVAIDEPEQIEEAEDVERREDASEIRETETETESELETALEADSELSVSAEPQPEQSEQPEQPDQPRESQEPQRDAPPGEVRDGEEADKDSDATSIIDVPRENWRLGRPLAAKGVEIKPERPHFTLLQMMTGLPRNPVVGIRFNNKGVPLEAVMLRNTGDRSMDAAIIASLYRWRAAGEAIDALEDKQTFDIQIRIVLVQRRGED